MRRKHQDDAAVAPAGSSTGEDDLRTEREERDGAEGGELLLAEQTCLFLVLHAERPLVGGARFSLDDIEEVVLGRSPNSCIEVERSNGRQLRLRLPSPLLSSTHARLLREGDAWRVEDTDSTNGVYVNGVRCTGRTLEPADVLEVGRIFFTLRSGTCPVGQAIVDRVSDTGRERLLGLDTLLPRVDARLSELSRVAASSVCVALSGETGTGKEVLARAIHAISRRTGLLVAVNCGALTSTLLESQLFGHVRGAFSGAVGDAVGFVRSAHAGTLLLDEAGDLSPPGQAALLRVLQEGEVVPVGASRPHRVDVRVITASAEPLERSVADGKFRADLFARLSGFSYRLAPLRQRREDLGVLIASLLRRLGVTEADKPRIAPHVGLALLSHPWSLNVRELEQWLRLGWVLSEQGLIAKPPAGSQEGEAHELPSESAPRVLSNTELALRRDLVLHLQRAKGNVAQVARAMGKAPVQVYRWMKRYCLDPESFRDE